MAKVMIYEDGFGDLISRYRRLVKDHDVHVRHCPDMDMSPFLLKELTEDYGFNGDNIVRGFGDPGSENADIYFVDGLKGRCFDILELLPKDRAYLNSDDTTLVSRVRERGFQVLRTSPERAVKEIGGK